MTFFGGTRAMVASMVVVCSFGAQLSFGQGKSITQSELRDAVRQSADARQKNLQQVRSFFDDANVRQTLSGAGMDRGRIQNAVSGLNASELEKLAARTAQVQKDFAAGTLTNQELTYIVIALGAAVIVLIAVAA